MKTKILSVLVLLVVAMFAGCDMGPLPVRTEAFTNDFRVVNFVSTNTVFFERLDGTRMRMTAESYVDLTNGQIVTAEAVIRGIRPSGQIERIILYPKKQ